jgi:hypothetical protein
MSQGDEPSMTMRVTEYGLSPLDQHDGDALSIYPVGAVVEVTVYRKPNPAYLRLLWAIMGEVYENTDWPTAKDLMNYLKTRAGYVGSYLTFKGEIHVTPRSLTELQEHELVEFGMKALDLLSTEIIPGLDIDEVARRKRRSMKRSMKA